MGQNQSSRSDADSTTAGEDSAGQHCCFALGQPPSFLKSSNNDPMGTPLPETPIHQRKRRQQIQQAMREDSKQPPPKQFYGGLEKESSRFISMSGGQSSVGQSSDDTNVYEGPDCEKRLFQKYQLMEVLGVGSTSTVHRCRNKATDQDYACKIINCQLIEERFAGMMTQFQTEIEALRALRHPSIIRLYDVYMTEEKFYIVMELMEGGELFDYVVKKGTLNEEEASNIVRKVTSAIAYMHSMNFIHRDLKPENLLLKKKPRGASDTNIDVKIIDFGLSKIMEEPVARTFLGTRGYLSPEQLSRRDYTKAVDSWALGVIVFVLLCGCLPFDDDSSAITNEELVHAKFQLRYPRWARNLSASAKDLLSHLLNIDPAKRYTAEQAMDHPWVRGVTAPKNNLLASPGQMKKSPVFVAKRKNGTGRTPQQQQHQKKCYADTTPPTPSQGKGNMIRKTSI